jgi:hypothetical protein|uniref:Uncharacterized protein n=1 Tax=Populus trichocarpa TaxID=3694 RepID=U5G565_POPTR
MKDYRTRKEKTKMMIKSTEIARGKERCQGICKRERAGKLFAFLISLKRRKQEGKFRYVFIVRVDCETG